MSQAALASSKLHDRSHALPTERRVDRSSFRADALEQMLEAFRHRHDLHAVLLADDHGLLLAGSAMPGINLEAIAAALPHDLEQNGLKALSFKLDCVSLYAGVVGAATVVNSPIEEIANAAKRILTY